jgi:polyisoprenyl-teichoic acid--peptidoglycan teichoic acid transferase
VTDDEKRNDAEGVGEDADAPEAPRPQTWAGRARAGEGSEDTESTTEPAAEEGHDAADEREEPPDEFEFADEAEGEEDDAGAEPEAESDEEPEAEADEEPEAEADEEPEAEADEEPEAEAREESEGAAEEQPEAEGEEGPEAEKPGQDTVEVDTLALVDREAEQEAAHAGLKARAQKSATARVATSDAQAAVAGAVATLPDEGAGAAPRRNVWWRFLAGSFVVIASTAAATAIAFLLYLTDIGNDLKGDETFANAVDQNLSDVEGGDPQTILILGSDKRTTEPGDPGRSDTTMLLRVDPEKEFLSLLSLPRDLMVEIPGYGGPYKLNEAYSYGEQEQARNKEGGGGPDLTLKTVKHLLGIDINHIVNVDFEGFYDAINAIGCVYIDIDRHYFNPVGGEYDDIDIKPGYRKLCGYTGLDYVRYRHNDNDLVRGARQQAFVREARQQIPPRSLLPPPFGDADLIDIFTEYTTSDIDTAPDIVEMLKAFVDVRNAPVRQVSLGELTVDGGVGASNEQIDTAVDEFLGKDLEEAPTEPAEPSEAAPKPEPKEKKEPAEPEAPAMLDVTATAEEYASQFQDWLRRHKAKLPVFYPTAVVQNINAGISEESLAHAIEHPDGPKEKPYYGYKYVLPYQESFGTSYYGVAGVNWVDPPILNNPSEVRRVDGRDYLVFYEKDRIRLLGWTTDDGAYWVSNTLTRTLSEDEMFAVATSVREFED